MNSPAGNWLSDIVAYFRFVNARRIDTRHRLIPSWSKLLIALFICAALIYGLFLWADPIVLEWTRQPDRQYPRIFQFITLLGKANWILFATGIILIILSLFNAKRFKGHKNLVWHRIFLNAYFTFSGVIFSGLLASLLKNVIARARPDYTPDSKIWLSMPFEHSYQYASFPSGHSTTAGAITMALLLLFPRWRWYLIIAGLLVGISRPVLGVHFPSDIAAGLILGAGFIWFYARIFARKRLLFKFSRNGSLVLRGEGKGKMKLLGNMMRQIKAETKGAADQTK